MRSNSFFCLSRIIETEAATIKMANNNIMANAFVKASSPIENKVAGMAGTKTFLVIKTATIEGIPNTMAVFKSIMPDLYFGNAPTKLLKPTMKSE